MNQQQQPNNNRNSTSPTTNILQAIHTMRSSLRNDKQQLKMIQKGIRSSSMEKGKYNNHSDVNASITLNSNKENINAMNFVMQTKQSSHQKIKLQTTKQNKNQPFKALNDSEKQKNILGSSSRVNLINSKYLKKLKAQIEEKIQFDQEDKENKEKADDARNDRREDDNRLAQSVLLTANGQTQKEMQKVQKSNKQPVGDQFHKKKKSKKNITKKTTEAMTLSPIAMLHDKEVGESQIRVEKLEKQLNRRRQFKYLDDADKSQEGGNWKQLYQPNININPNSKQQKLQPQPQPQHKSNQQTQTTPSSSSPQSSTSILLLKAEHHKQIFTLKTEFQKAKSLITQQFESVLQQQRAKFSQRIQEIQEYVSTLELENKQLLQYKQSKQQHQQQNKKKQQAKGQESKQQPQLTCRQNTLKNNSKYPKKEYQSPILNKAQQSPPFEIQQLLSPNNISLSVIQKDITSTPCCNCKGQLTQYYQQIINQLLKENTQLSIKLQKQVVAQGHSHSRSQSQSDRYQHNKCLQERKNHQQQPQHQHVIRSNKYQYKHQYKSYDEYSSVQNWGQTQNQFGSLEAKDSETHNNVATHRIDDDQDDSNIATRRITAMRIVNYQRSSSGRSRDQHHFHGQQGQKQQNLSPDVTSYNGNNDDQESQYHPLQNDQPQPQSQAQSYSHSHSFSNPNPNPKYFSKPEQPTTTFNAFKGVTEIENHSLVESDKANNKNLNKTKTDDINKDLRNNGECSSKTESRSLNKNASKRSKKPRIANKPPTNKLRVKTQSSCCLLQEMCKQTNKTIILKTQQTESPNKQKQQYQTYKCHQQSQRSQYQQSKMVKSFFLPNNYNSSDNQNQYQYQYQQINNHQNDNLNNFASNHDNEHHNHNHDHSNYGYFYGNNKQQFDNVLAVRNQKEQQPKSTKLEQNQQYQQTKKDDFKFYCTNENDDKENHNHEDATHNPNNEDDDDDLQSIKDEQLRMETIKKFQNVRSQEIVDDANKENKQQEKQSYGHQHKKQSQQTIQKSIAKEATVGMVEMIKGDQEDVICQEVSGDKFVIQQQQQHQPQSSKNLMTNMMMKKNNKNSNNRHNGASKSFLSLFYSG